MNNTVNQEDTSPDTISKSKKGILSLILIPLGLLALVGVAYLYIKNETTLISKNRENTKKENILNTQKEEEKQATISGTLSFPGETIPYMNVCAVNVENMKETCIQTKENHTYAYTLSVDPGTYLIYSATIPTTEGLVIKAYYTKCDTYEDGQTDPRCNSNFNESNGGWYDEKFVCYKDTACKEAFTPLPVTVVENQKLELKQILQGWYIPCHGPKCNNPDFDVWKEYIEL